MGATKQAPEFDPSKPFEAANAPEFDPSQSFEVERPGALSRIGDTAGRAVGWAAGKVFGPIGAIGAQVEKVTGAPLRAGVGAAMDGGDVLGAMGDQLGAGLPSLDSSSPTGLRPGEILPTTPGGSDIALRGIKGAGVASPYAEKMAPFAGALVDGGLDATNLIPGEGALKALGKIRGSALGVAKGFESGAASVLMKTGNIATQGTLPYGKAMKAAHNLSSLELLYPGTPNFGPMAKAMAETGAVRQAIKEGRIAVPGSHDVAVDALTRVRQARIDSGDVMVPNADKIEAKIDGLAFHRYEILEDVPLTPQELQQADDLLLQIGQEMHAAEGDFLNFIPQTPAQQQQFMRAQEARNKGIAEFQSMLEWRYDMAPGRAPNMSHVPTRQVPRQITERRDLTLNELDDITGILDTMTYTTLGNPKGTTRFWGPAIRKTRAEMDQAMQTVPEGQLFKQVKSHQEDLMTVAKGRSKLMTGVGLVGAAAAGPWALLSLGIIPQTYYRLMGAAKVPGDVMRTLMAAHETGKLATMREALESFAEKQPFLAERLVRATTLISGKPTGQQFLTDDEASTLGATRSFDPEDLVMERMRIQEDPKLSSIEKAKKLTDIHKSGYVVMEARRPKFTGPPAPIKKTASPINGSVDDLIRSMQTTGP